MKLRIHFKQLLLLVLLAATVQADISLTLRNKQYLPPSTQELPLSQDNYNIIDTSDSQPQQKFERNNLENARYQVYEVHTHYGHANRNEEHNSKLSDAQINFPSRNHSPFRKISSEKIRIEHVNAPPDVSLDDPNLDVSYLSLVAGNDDRNPRIIVNHAPRNSDIPVRVPFPSNFQHTLQHSAPDYSWPHSSSQHSSRPEQQFLIIPRYPAAQQSSHTSDGNKSFKSADFSSQELHSNRTNYSPPQQYHFRYHGLSSGYPLQSYALHDASQARDYSSHESFEQNIDLRNSNYLSSEQRSSNRTEESIVPTSQFKGPKYLPPQADFKGSDYFQENATQPESKQFESHEINDNSTFKSSEFLAPQSQPQQSNYESSTASKGQDQQQVQNNAAFQVYQQQILPPGYDFVKPPNAEQAIEELHRLPEESPVTEEPSNTVYDTPKQAEIILKSGVSPAANNTKKPENSENAINLLHNQENRFPTTDNFEHFGHQEQSRESSGENVQSEGAKTLATGYSSQDSASAQQARSLQHDQENSPGTSPVQQIHGGTYSYQNQNERQNNKQLSELSVQQPFKGLEYLPPRKAPEHSPPTPASQTFKASSYTYRSEVFKGSEYLPPTVGYENYKDSHNLPTVASKQSDISLPIQQSSDVFKAPRYLPPAKNEPTYQSLQQPQFKGPQYLPPAAPTATQGLQSIIMYPFSSYTINITHDRYGTSRPFPEYGPPPTKATINEVPHIYQISESRPTMSYFNNAFGKQTSTTPAQSQQQPTSTLNSPDEQTLMVEDKEQPTTKSTVSSEALQITKPATKIRTVKIHNTNASKTLKVLESFDDAGVKTIKILGSADEPTMAKYRLVKVVSGSNEQEVQTVQIFNDPQDNKANENSAASDGQSNYNYLPPRSTRNSNKKTKIQGPERI